jgi:hypothetical protein
MTDDPGVAAETFRRADGRSLTAFELTVYGRAGLTRQEAVAWADAKIEPYQAEAFRAMGLDLAEATAWVERGVSGQRFASWVRAGLDPAVEVNRPRPVRAEEPASTPRPSTDSYQISTSEIAALAKVDPSVVSNWRKRHQDTFPQPVVEGRRKLFDADAVLNWLADNGKMVRKPEWLGSRTLGQLAMKTDMSRDGLAAFVLIGALAHGLVPGVKAPEARRLPAVTSSRRTFKSGLRHLARELEDAHVELAGLLVDAIGHRTTPGPRLAAVAGVILGGFETDEPATGMLDGALDVLATDRARGPATWTSHALAEIMVALACRPGASVLDPAAGEGELLIWAAGRTGSDASRHGTDRDAAAWRVARVRLLLRGLTSDLHVADSFENDPFIDRRVDAVLVDPPLYGDAPAVEWLRYAVTHLAEGGRAAIAMPARSGPRSALAEAFRRREVEAVVLLPASARSDARGPLAVALLAPPPQRFDRVLVVDLRRSSRSVWSRQALASTVSFRPTDRLPVGWIETVLDDFRRGATEFDPEPLRDMSTAGEAPTARSVPASRAAVEILDGDVSGPIRPSRAAQLAERLTAQLNDERDPASAELRRALEAYLRQTESP